MKKVGEIMKPKVFVIDLDGTLLNSNGEISHRSCSALIKASNQGFKLIIATARPPRTVNRLLPDILHNICSYIYYNGAMIKCTESNFSFHLSIDSSLSAEILDFCLLQDPNINISIEVEDQWFALEGFHPTMLKWVRDQPVMVKLEEIKMLKPTKILV